MFCGKWSDNLIMKTHYRCLRCTIINKDVSRLRINGKIDIHTQNNQILMTEIYKCPNKKSPPFTWDYFNQKSYHYNLRRKHLLQLHKCRTKTYGLSTAVFKGAVIWKNPPNHFKDPKSLAEFKTLIREWTQFSCTYCICS